MIRNFKFKSIYRPRYLFLILLACLIFILQSGDNLTLNASEFVADNPASLSHKADRLMPQAGSSAIPSTRLAHLWDGTPEAELSKMPAPKADRLILAYAPGNPLQSDALNALKRFDTEDKVEIVPQPKPRPVKALAAAAKKSLAPMALLAKNFPKVTPTIQQPASVQAEDIKLASIAPVSIPSPVQSTETISVLSLPYTPQITSVKTACFPEKLVGLMQKIEEKYHRKVIVTSGLRDHGRKGSLHLHCEAADIIVPGVSSVELASFARTLPGVGGIGRYCHPYMIHIDIGSTRDWLYGCKKQEAHTS